MMVRYIKFFTFAVLVAAVLVIANGASIAATKIGSIPISKDGNRVSMLQAEQGYLYLGLLSSDGGLHCYSTNQSNLLWSASVGSVVDAQTLTGFRALKPRRVALSPGMQYVNVLTDRVDRLVVLNQSDGSIVDERDIDGAERILTCAIAGIEYILVVSDGVIHLIDQGNIQSDVLQVTIPQGMIGGIEYDDTSDTLYSVLQDTDTVVYCAFTSVGGVLSYSIKTSDTDDKPYDCKLIGNSVFVACTKSGTINKFNKATLLPEATYSGLKNVSYIDVSGDCLTVASYYNPLSGSTDPRGSVLFLDVATEIANTINIDDTHPVYVDNGPLPSSVVVFNEGTLDKVKTSNSVSVKVRDGNMWVYDVSSGALTDNTLLSEGYFISAYCMVTQRMYIVEAGGTAIDVYTF